MNDTIAAIATPPGRGGVGIVRVSGPNTKHICLGITGNLPTPRFANYTVFKNSDQSQIDQGLCIFFVGPKSFTGEDVLELHAHGGPVVLDMLLRRVLELGARIARAGEFSERAFLNNKMDLLQVEAVAELINASSEQAAIAATRSLQGDFSKLINGLVESLIRLRLYVEAAIDFPEEEINFLADAHITDSLQALLAQVINIYVQAQQGVLLSEGVNAVIVGRPNAGKSTLLNALTGEETAIVTPIAGTTRDTIRARIHIDGVLVNVVDTAGLRETDDIVEQHGIARAVQAIALADLVLLVVDASNENVTNPWILYPELKNQIKNNTKVMVIYNKIDQLGIGPYTQHNDNYTTVAISAHQKVGIDVLREQIKKIVGVTQCADNGLFLARRRHLDALNRARNSLEIGKQQLEHNSAGELLAEELKQAQQALSEITGQFTSDDLLGRIFSEFCIGK
jgi:tRNA modification GTPase